MDQPPALDKRAEHIAIAMELTIKYRTAGPMAHATGKGCSPVPLPRLRDLMHSLHEFQPDLPDRQSLPYLPTFDGFPDSPTSSEVPQLGLAPALATVHGGAQAALEGF